MNLNFGLIHLSGQLYDPDPEMEAYIFNSSHLINYVKSHVNGGAKFALLLTKTV